MERVSIMEEWKRSIYYFYLLQQKEIKCVRKRLIRIFHATDSFNVQKDDKEVEVYVQEISYYRVFFDWREYDGGKNKIRRLCEAPSKMAG